MTTPRIRCRRGWSVSFLTSRIPATASSFGPAADLTAEQMASLEAALKTAIQVHFQLEDRELANRGTAQRGRAQADFALRGS